MHKGGRTIMGKNIRVQIAKRAEKELHDGDYINLRIGMPRMIANHISDNKSIVLQLENGLLDIGPYPTEEEVDPDLINAGKETVTTMKGASFFSNAESFAMIRGGHIDVAVLGGMEIGENGDLANWMIPGKMIKGMGGAMDLVRGATHIIIIMEHVTRNGDSKILNSCTLPLTGKGVVDRIITDRAVIDVTENGLKLIEIAEGYTLDDVIQSTEPELIITDDVIYDAY